MGLGVQELGLSFACQIQFAFRCGPGFLDNAVQQDDFFTDDDEEDPDDAVVQRAADFPEAAAKGIHQRLADRPCPLDGEDVGTNGFPLFARQCAEPLPDRFVFCQSAEENDAERALCGSGHAGVYQYWNVGQAVFRSVFAK